jgi:hypothetical protein
LDIELKLKELELTALDNTADSPLCRAVLNSLWCKENNFNPGTDKADGCNLHTLVRAGNDTFEAIMFTLRHFHQHQDIGLENFMSEEQIADINKYSGASRSD